MCEDDNWRFIEDIEQLSQIDGEKKKGMYEETNQTEQLGRLRLCSQQQLGEEWAFFGAGRRAA
jgi:hypothetical protein